jgi:hypothetical protein
MTETGNKVDKMKDLRPQLRIGLLALQILLPLAAYYALRAGQTGPTWGLAVTFVVSMVGLIWVG